MVGHYQSIERYFYILWLIIWRVNVEQQLLVFNFFNFSFFEVLLKRIECAIVDPRFWIYLVRFSFERGPARWSLGSCRGTQSFFNRLQLFKVCFSIENGPFNFLYKFFVVNLGPHFCFVFVYQMSNVHVSQLRFWRSSFLRNLWSIKSSNLVWISRSNSGRSCLRVLRRLKTRWVLFRSRKALFSCFGVSANTGRSHLFLDSKPHSIGLTRARTFSRNLSLIFAMKQNFAQILIIKSLSWCVEIAQPNPLVLVILYQIFQERTRHVFAWLLWNFL